MRTVIRWGRREGHSQRGQSLAEWGLAVTFLLIFLGGAAQVGVIYYSLMAVDTAARESARVASENPGNTGATAGGTSTIPYRCTTGDPHLACKAAVNSTHNGAFGGLIDTSKLTVDLSWAPYNGNPATTCSGGTGSTDGVVSATISYDVPIFVPLIGTTFYTNGNPVHTVSTSVTMRIEPCDNTGGN